MKTVLVDTSVWVDHFRKRNSTLVELLLMDRVICHPFIVGEIACGTPPNRQHTLADFNSLQQAKQASMPELLALIEREQLFGLGCGLVDLMLLASALLSDAELWTLDKRLGQLADRFGVLHNPAVH